jgi:hypothetical protein
LMKSSSLYFDTQVRARVNAGYGIPRRLAK